MDPSVQIVLGLLWCFAGVVWFYRARRQEANPRTPVSLFIEPEVQSDKDRTWKIRLAVLNVMIGGIYMLFGIFSYHH